MGGSGPSGTTTTTMNQTPWDSGNLQEIHNTTMDLLRNSPYTYYPGQTYATPNATTELGISNAGNTALQAGEIAGGITPEMQGTALNANNWLAGGGGFEGAQPWLTSLTAGSSANPAQDAIAALMGVPSGTAGQSLGATASGAFLNSNPYTSDMVMAATDPLVRQYQTATAPTTDSRMNQYNRYGSGASANATSVNEQNLAKGIGDISSNLYGTQFSNERNLMNQAAAALGGLQNTAYGTAGQLGVSGTNAQTSAATSALDAWNKLLGGQQAAINSTPGLSNMFTNDYSAAINSGNQQQQLDQAALNDQIARYYGVQSAKWQGPQQAAAIFGTPIIGSSATQQPYFSPSPFSQILGGASSGLGIAKALMK
jgi:hypothetical protein